MLLYRVITIFLYPFLVLFIFLRTFYNKEDKVRFKEKIFSEKFNIEKNTDSKLIWFHAASIGELKSILPIIRKLNSENKLEFLITTITLSSSKLADEELKNIPNTKHRFLPLDINFLMKGFLKSWKPHAIFLVDSEIWPNLVINAKKLNIPLALINARISKKTFKRWKMFPFINKSVFRCFDLCLASNLETKKYLKELNVKNIHYIGNLKLINNVRIENTLNKKNEIFLKDKSFWLAASTHDTEEIFCFDVHLKIRKRIPNFYTIIAPRHLERIQKIENLCLQKNLSYQILDKDSLIESRKEIILVNFFGKLHEFYKYAKSVFVGKSTIESIKYNSGQNPIEAAKFGCKIYHGKYVYNFKEIYETLSKNAISFKIENPEDLANKIISDNKSDLQKFNKTPEIIKKLEASTLEGAMKHIQQFIFNESL